MAKKYTGLKLPTELADLIDELIKSGYLGYRNRGEFVTDAVRRRIEHIKELKASEKSK